MKKEPTITYAQARLLDEKLQKFKEGLDAEEADWLLHHFARMEDFVRRRPDDGLLTREFTGSYDVQGFTPRRKTLEAASLLKYRASEYSRDDKPEFFPGAYDGPKSVRFAMHAYAVGGPPYRQRSMYNTPTGLPRVAIDLRLRGLQAANFHQAASLAAWWNDDEKRAQWLKEYGPCRIYALGSRSSEHQRAIVPVLLSPGIEDHASWMLDYVFEDDDRHRQAEAWFLTVASD